MDKKERRDEVFSLLAELCGSAEMDEGSSLQTELGLDSLGLVTLLVELEEMLGITLDESDMDPFALLTVGDVVRLAQKYGGETNE